MSERGLWAQKAYSWTIIVFDSSNTAVTGLVNANFTKRLAKDDANSAVAVTVTEIDSVNLPGWYKVTFTPNANGHWACQVSHATYNVRGWFDEVQVYTRELEDLAFPATTGRSILVNLDGWVAPDWANVKSPTTTVGLTGTTIATSQTITSVSGSVGSVTGAVGSVTGNVGGTLANLASGAKTDVENAVWDALLSSHVVAGSMAEALASVVVRTGTVQGGGASSITLDAGASATNNLYRWSFVKIKSGTGAGQVGFITAYNGTSKVATISNPWIVQPDNTSVFSVNPFSTPGVDWASIINPSNTTNLSGTTIAAVSGAVGSVTGNVGGNVTGNVAGDVQGKVIGGGASTITGTGAQVDKTGYTLSAAGVQAIWDALVSALTTVGSIGKRLADNVDAAVSSRATPAQILATPANLLATDVSGRVTVGAMAAGVIAAATFAVGALAAVWDEVTSGHVIVNTFGKLLGLFSFTGANVNANAQVVADKTGYALTAAEENAIADAILKRDLSNVEPAGQHTLAGGLQKLTCKVVLSADGTTLTIYRSNGVVSFTQTTTTDANANPVTSVA